MNERPLFEEPAGVVLAECDEFKLFRLPTEETVLWMSPKVQMAYWKARFVISGSNEDAEDKVRLALAIRRLAYYTKFDRPNGDCDDGWRFPLTHELADTIGTLVVGTISRTSVIDVSDLVNEAGNRLKAALRHFLQGEDLRDAGKGDRRVKVWGLIDRAGWFFQNEMKPPTKSRLRRVFEEADLAVTGHDIAADWRDLFVEAALSGLPD